MHAFVTGITCLKHSLQPEVNAASILVLQTVVQHSQHSVTRMSSNNSSCNNSQPNSVTKLCGSTTWQQHLSMLRPNQVQGTVTAPTEPGINTAMCQQYLKMI
jgi:hypothetical protein